MKQEYEKEIVTDEDYLNLDWRLRDGWEIEKTEVIKKEERTLFFKKDKLVKVYYLRRDKTPTKVKLNLILTIPKWKINMKQIYSWEFTNQINEQLIKMGLKKEVKKTDDE